MKKPGKNFSPVQSLQSAQRALGLLVFARARLQHSLGIDFFDVGVEDSALSCSDALGLRHVHHMERTGILAFRAG